MKSYDLVIIGSGPAGYVAALYASRHHLNVCVIEKDLVGGTCLNRGCIPTKVMLNSASIISTLKESPAHGIDLNGYNVNFQRIVSRKDEVVSRLKSGIETLFRANKIDLIKGEAVLKSQNEIEVRGVGAVNAKSVIIACGSKASGLPGVEIDEALVLSSDGILNMKELPRSILIIGGGVIGCEFASLFNALGTKVVVVELLDRLIASQSKEASKRLELLFKKRGMSIFTSCKVESITRDKTLKANISNGEVVEADKVLVAVGRVPDTSSLGLEGLKIRAEKGRILVDEFLRTDVKNIYAAGDCIGGPLLAHKASYEGVIACDNILGRPRRPDYSSIPNCIYTEPEIASVGLSEEEAKEKHPDCRIAKFPFSASGKAWVMGRPEGFIKMIGSSEGAILGIEIFGEGSCDLIGEAVLAKSMNVNIKDLSRVVHGHPTLSEIFQEAAHIFCGTPIHGL